MAWIVEQAIFLGKEARGFWWTRRCRRWCPSPLSASSAVFLLHPLHHFLAREGTHHSHHRRGDPLQIRRKRQQPFGEDVWTAVIDEAQPDGRIEGRDGTCGADRAQIECRGLPTPNRHLKRTLFPSAMRFSVDVLQTSPLGCEIRAGLSRGLTPR